MFSFVNFVFAKKIFGLVIHCKKVALYLSNEALRLKDLWGKNVYIRFLPLHK
jgi:hypothetical protein